MSNESSFQKVVDRSAQAHVETELLDLYSAIGKAPVHLQHELKRLASCGGNTCVRVIVEYKTGCCIEETNGIEEIRGIEETQHLEEIDDITGNDESLHFNKAASNELALRCMVNQFDHVRVHFVFDELDDDACYLERVEAKLKALGKHIQQALALHHQLVEHHVDQGAVRHVVQHAPSLSARASQRITDMYGDLKDIQTRIARLSKNEALNLTNAEMMLSGMLFRGDSLATIADERGVSEQTVRKQLQSVLKKTECENQEALIIYIFEKGLRYTLNEPHSDQRSHASAFQLSGQERMV